MFVNAKCKIYTYVCKYTYAYKCKMHMNIKKCAFTRVCVCARMNDLTNSPFSVST